MDIGSLIFLPLRGLEGVARRTAACRDGVLVAAAKTESTAVALCSAPHYSRTATRETLDLPVRVSTGYRAAKTSGIVNEVSGLHFREYQLKRRPRAPVGGARQSPWN
jgi:hypothetical protein